MNNRFNLDVTESGPSREYKRNESVEGSKSGSGSGSGSRWRFKQGDVPSILSGPADCENYSMNYLKKGKCYIFSNGEFDENTEMNNRKGTHHDVQALCDVFEYLGFEEKDIHCFIDLEQEDIIREIKKVSKEDNSLYACFVCCILTHGYAGLLYARDGQYIAERIFAPLRGDACLSLAGKPKIFIIQACEGDKSNPEDGDKFLDSTDCGSRSKQVIKIPIHADFLIAYCRVPGYYAWENEDTGSWFIQSLCEVLHRNSREKDLLQMLTAVNREIAGKFDNNSFDMQHKKQVPYVTSTLTKNIRF